MKNIEEGSIKHLILLIICIAICGILLFPAYDFIYANFIVKETFTYSIKNHLIEPISFSFISGLILWLLSKKK